MKTFEIEVTEEITRTYRVEVPNEVGLKNIETWSRNNPDFLRGIKQFNPRESWSIHNLLKDKLVRMNITCTNSIVDFKLKSCRRK